VPAWSWREFEKEDQVKYGLVIGSIFALLFAVGFAASFDDARQFSTTGAFHIGQSYGGGIIFWLDASGQHGLIAATSDQGYTWWGDRYYYATGATGTAIGTGSVNTTKIIAVQGTKYTYAARLCRDYRGGGYSDWFLPSKDEIYQLYLQKSVVGGFIRGGYYSSSEFDHTLAWQKYFYNDNATTTHKDRYDGVRAIRAF
jgi:hypothetical protein